MRNSWIRVLLSAVLVGIVLYFVQSRKHGRTRLGSVPSKPLLSDSVAPDGSKRFTWVPRYPDAEIEDIRTARTSQQVSYGYRFRAKEEGPAILTYYETQLRAAGFTVVSKTNGGKDEEGALHAENPDRRRILDVNYVKTPEGAQIGVAAIER